MDCLDMIVNGCSCGSGSKNQIAITNIAESNDKIIVTLNNGTFLEADITVLDKSILNKNTNTNGSSNNETSQEILDKIKTLEEKTKVLDNLTEVSNFSGTETFLTLTK